MLERILAYSRQQNKQPPTPSSVEKPVVSVDLAAVTVLPSRYLWQAQLIIYSAMLVFAFIALLPFFFAAAYWILLWLVFAFLIGVAIYKSWQAKNAAPMQFEIKQNNWRLKTSKGEFSVTPNDEILLWSWVIVIPLRETLTRNLHYLIALPDSLTKEDWRRLRVWLMTCLK